MTHGYDDPTVPIPLAAETLELELVADSTATLCGELLAWRAVAHWRLPCADRFVPRVRALVAAASAAVAPLDRIDVRLEYHLSAVILEVVFPHSAPRGFAPGLKPAAPGWTWYHNNRGQLCLHDEFRLDAPHSGTEGRR